MNLFISENELWIRLGFFLGVFFALACLELVIPQRELGSSKLRRWLSNLSIVGLNSFLLRLVMPVMAIDMGFLVEKNGWGLFNFMDLSYWGQVVAGVVLLDFIIYLQHRLFHYLPILWRLHRMHHADSDFDVSLGSRFHPIEILLSMIIKIAAVLAFGIPAAAVLLFEVLLNATALFTHANLRLPQAMDRIVRLVLVTPDMHRVHHSVHPKETNSNFGFNLSLWDRLCRTYTAKPDKGQRGMTIGLQSFRSRHFLDLPWLLAIPFIEDERKH